LANCGEGPEGPEADTCRVLDFGGCEVVVVGSGPIRLKKLAAADVLPPPRNGLLGFGADIGPDALLVILILLSIDVRALLDMNWLGALESDA
jgi:hypothetical protein